MLGKIILDVDDLSRSIAFYQSLLGCSAETGYDARSRVDFGVLKAGSTRVMLVARPLWEQSPHLDRTGGMVLNFQVNNLERIKTVFSEYVLSTQLELIPGHCDTGILMTDPDGYALWISQTNQMVS
jgi:catechol-2,3-dioxygenase